MSGKVETENGAASYSTTLSPVVDFFSKVGALRGNESDLITLFKAAFEADEKLALRAMFYMRDVRGGQGERGSFRSLLVWLAQNSPEALLRNLIHIPMFGRWDDFYSIIEEPSVSSDVQKIIKEQFEKDMELAARGKNVSLLGKWLKSANTSSPASRHLGKVTFGFLGLSPKEYRKALVLLRNQIEIVEQKMVGNEWKDINYSNVPSHAMLLYKKAFAKHDKEGFEAYINSVKEGKSKINAAALYPYDIVKQVMAEPTDIEKETLNEQWKALPDYVEGSTVNAIVVADVSGSMTYGNGSVRPIDVAISLAIYFAERSKGAFANHFMTFTSYASINELKGDSIYEKVKNLERADWGNSTNLMAVFTNILEMAKQYNIPQEEMPQKIFIISDMQFNCACRDNSLTNFEAIEKMYKESGYTRPDLIFWNVNAHSDFPVQKDETGTFLVSGCSPSIMKHALNTDVNNAEELMLEVLNSKRYSLIL